MKRKALTLAVILFTTYNQANIDITTLSDWDINDFDEEVMETVGGPETIGAESEPPPPPPPPQAEIIKTLTSSAEN